METIKNDKQFEVTWVQDGKTYTKPFATHEDAVKWVAHKNSIPSVKKTAKIVE